MYEDHKKVTFRLERDEDGYPPADTETLWVEVIDNNLVVDSIPFFVPGVSCGDVIRAEEEDGILWFSEVIQPSSNSTVRIFASDRNDVPSIREELQLLGCESEKSHLPRLIAVNIPPEADIPKVRAYLDNGFNGGRFDYQESSVNWY